MTLANHKLTQVLKANKFFLQNDLEVAIAEHIKEKINVENVSTYHQLKSLFNMPTLMTVTSDYIQRCFTMVAKTENFLQLDFNHVDKILSSSELNVFSELEVFHAADFWLRCKDFDRTKFASQLFLKIRLPLLTDHAIKDLFGNCGDLADSSSFHQNNECLVLINQVLKNKDEFNQNKPKTYFTNRYCDSTMYDLLVFGGFDQTSKIKNMNVYQANVDNLNNFKVYTQLMEWKISKAFYLSGELYCLCYRYEMTSFKKYSRSSKTWETLGNYRLKYPCDSVFSFIDSIFVIGHTDDEIATVTVFDVTTKKWEFVTPINEVRIDAACALFGGKVVVSGGWNFDNLNGTNTIEVYDHVADTWSYFPTMNHARSGHKLLAVSMKLFAIGDYRVPCEFYNSFCKKFVVLKQTPSNLRFDTVVLISREIYFFQDCNSEVVVYNVDKDVWSRKSSNINKHLKSYDILKIPQI